MECYLTTLNDEHIIRLTARRMLKRAAFLQISLLQSPSEIEINFCERQMAKSCIMIAENAVLEEDNTNIYEEDENEQF